MTIKEFAPFELTYEDKDDHHKEHTVTLAPGEVRLEVEREDGTWHDILALYLKADRTVNVIGYQRRLTSMTDVNETLE